MAAASVFPLYDKSFADQTLGRSTILFAKDVTTYNFAGKALLQFAGEEKMRNLPDEKLAQLIPGLREHLELTDFSSSIKSALLRR